MSKKKRSLKRKNPSLLDADEKLLVAMGAGAVVGVGTTAAVASILSDKPISNAKRITYSTVIGIGAVGIGFLGTLLVLT